MLCQNSLQVVFCVFFFWNDCFCLGQRDSAHCNLPKISSPQVSHCQSAENSVLKPWKPANELGQRSRILPDLKWLDIHLKVIWDKSTHQLTIWLVTFLCNWPLPKTCPPQLLLLCSTSHAALTPHIMFSRSEKKHCRAKRALPTRAIVLESGLGLWTSVAITFLL